MLGITGSPQLLLKSWLGNGDVRLPPKGTNPHTVSDSSLSPPFPPGSNSDGAKTFTGSLRHVSGDNPLTSVGIAGAIADTNQRQALSEEVFISQGRTQEDAREQARMLDNLRNGVLAPADPGMSSHEIYHRTLDAVINSLPPGGDKIKLKFAAQGGLGPAVEKSVGEFLLKIDRAPESERNALQTELLAVLTKLDGNNVLNVAKQLKLEGALAAIVGKITTAEEFANVAETLAFNHIFPAGEQTREHLSAVAKELTFDRAKLDDLLKQLDGLDNSEKLLMLLRILDRRQSDSVTGTKVPTDPGVRHAQGDPTGAEKTMPAPVLSSPVQDKTGKGNDVAPNKWMNVTVKVSPSPVTVTSPVTITSPVTVNSNSNNAGPVGADSNERQGTTDNTPLSSAPNSAPVILTQPEGTLSGKSLEIPKEKPATEDKEGEPVNTQGNVRPVSSQPVNIAAPAENSGNDGKELPPPPPPPPVQQGKLTQPLPSKPKKPAAEIANSQANSGGTLPSQELPSIAARIKQFESRNTSTPIVEDFNGRNITYPARQSIYTTEGNTLEDKPVNQMKRSSVGEFSL